MKHLWKQIWLVVLFYISSFFVWAATTYAATPTYKVETNVSEIVLPMGETVDVYSILKYADTNKEVGLGANISNVYWEIDTAEIIDYKRLSCDDNPVPCFTNDIVVSGYQLGTVKLTALVMIDGGSLQIKAPPIKIKVVPAGQTKVVTPFVTPSSYPTLINYGNATPSSSLDTIQMLYAEYPGQEPGQMKSDLYVRGKIEAARQGNVIMIPLQVYFNQDSNPLEAKTIPVEQDPWQFLQDHYKLGFAPASQVVELAAQPQIFNQFNREALDRYLEHTQGELSQFQNVFLESYVQGQEMQFLILVLKKESFKPGMWTPTVRLPGQRVSDNQLQFSFNWLRDDFPDEYYLVQYQLGVLTQDPFLGQGKFYEDGDQAVYSVKDEVFPREIFGFTSMPYLSELYFKIRPNDTHFLITQSQVPKPEGVKPIKLVESAPKQSSESASEPTLLQEGKIWPPVQFVKKFLANSLYVMNFLPKLASLTMPHQDATNGFYLTQQPYDPLVITSAKPVPISVILRSSDGKTVIDQADLQYEWSVGNQDLVSINGEPRVDLFAPCCSSKRILPYPSISAELQAKKTGTSFYTVVVRNIKTGEKLVTARFPVEVKRE
jgi:hypothetical protein